MTSLIVLGSAMELCGNDLVRPLLGLPTAFPSSGLWGCGLQAPGSHTSAPELSLCPPSQVYAYASSVFLEAGVPQEKVQYAIIGTGCCELLSVFLNVSLALGWSCTHPAGEGAWGADSSAFPLTTSSFRP